MLFDFILPLAFAEELNRYFQIPLTMAAFNDNLFFGNLAENFPTLTPDIPHKTTFPVLYLRDWMLAHREHLPD